MEEQNAIGMMNESCPQQPELYTQFDLVNHFANDWKGRPVLTSRVYRSATYDVEGEVEVRVLIKNKPIATEDALELLNEVVKTIRREGLAMMEEKPSPTVRLMEAAEVALHMLRNSDKHNGDTTEKQEVIEMLYGAIEGFKAPKLRSEDEENEIVF